MSEKSVHPLEDLFYPQNIAVVGASPRGGLPGGRWGGTTYIEGSVRQHFKGKIFPIHPTAKSILGLPAYPRIRDIPDEVDLAIFSVPFKVVLEVMADCAAKGVKYVHLFTAGFSETGREDLARLESDMIQMARLANGTMRHQKGIYEGNTQEGILFVGQVTGPIRDLPTVKDLVDRIMAEAEKTLEKTNRMVTAKISPGVEGMSRVA